MKVAIPSGILGILIFLGCREEHSDSDNWVVEGFANANFCHAIEFYDGSDTFFTVVVGSGDDEVFLSAFTGECAAEFGGDCASIPAGRGVPLRLIDEYGVDTYFDLVDANGYLSSDSTLDIAEAGDLSFVLTVDDYGYLVLFTGDDQNIEYSCEESACWAGMPTIDTCDVSDPCGWVGDDFCDADCVYYSDTPLNDVVDLDSCVICSCFDELDACNAFQECLYLYDCIYTCGDDTVCIDECDAAYPNGMEAQSALDSCVQSNCFDFLIEKK